MCLSLSPDTVQTQWCSSSTQHPDVVSNNHFSLRNRASWGNGCSGSGQERHTVSTAERREWLGSAGENLRPLGYPQQTPASTLLPFGPEPQHQDAARPEDTTRPSHWQQLFLGAPPTLVVPGGPRTCPGNGRKQQQQRLAHGDQYLPYRVRAHALSGPGMGSDQGKCFLFAATSSLREHFHAGQVQRLSRQE